MLEILTDSQFCRIEVPPDHHIVSVHLMGEFLYVHYDIAQADDRRQRIFAYNLNGGLLIRGEPFDSEERFWIYRDWDDQGFVIYTHDEDLTKKYCLIDGRQFGPCRSIEAYRVEWGSRWSVTEETDSGICISYSGGKSIGPFREVRYISGNEEDSFYWVTRDDGCYLCSEREGLIEGPFVNDSFAIRESTRYNDIELLRTELFRQKNEIRKREKETNRVPLDLWTIRHKEGQAVVTLDSLQRSSCPVTAIESDWPDAPFQYEKLKKLVYPFQFLFEDRSYLLFKDGRLEGPHGKISRHWRIGPDIWLVEQCEGEYLYVDQKPVVLFRNGMLLGEFASMDYMPQKGILALARETQDQEFISLHQLFG